MSIEKGTLHRGSFYLARPVHIDIEGWQGKVCPDRSNHPVLGNRPGNNQFTGIDVIAAVRKGTGAYTVFEGLVLKGDGNDVERIENATDLIARELIDDHRLNIKAFDILEEKLDKRNKETRDAARPVLH